MVEIVNVVGSGSLDIELDLEQAAKDLGSNAEYDPDKYPGMYLRFGEGEPLITVYRTGKYIVTGADSKDEAYSIRERLLRLLVENRILDTPEDDWFRIQNLVCTADLEDSLNLNALAIGLGLEKTEYEPEQFPGLIYRPESAAAVVLLFASGKVVVTGSESIEQAQKVFQDLAREVESLLV